jgi:hypothetical protein
MILQLNFVALLVCYQVMAMHALDFQVNPSSAETNPVESNRPNYRLAELNDDKYEWLLSEAFAAYTNCLINPRCDPQVEQDILSFIETRLASYELTNAIRQNMKQREVKAKRNAVVKKESNSGKKKIIKDFLTIRF